MARVRSIAWSRSALQGPRAIRPSRVILHRGRACQAATPFLEVPFLTILYSSGYDGSRFGGPMPARPTPRVTEDIADEADSRHSRARHRRFPGGPPGRPSR